MSEQSQKSPALSNLSREERRFEPPADLAANANVTEEAYARADADREAFWAEAAERLDWGTKWDQVLDWSNPPFAKWFVGGTLNASVNCVDRHVAAGNGDKVAIHWVGEPDDDTRDITYAQLKDEVSRAANALTELGVKKGDRVAIYMPMIPEVVVAMLACARLGAPHTVVFGGFSADALASRVTDCEAHVVITSDGGYRRGAASALKPAVDEAVEKTGDLVRHVLVVRRTGQDVAWDDSRDVWWHDVVDSASRRARAGDARLRAPALRHVHLRHDRQAQGHPAHHRRLPHRHVVHPLVGLRPQGRRRLLVHRRRRLGDRPLLHDLRSARQRRDPGDVRGHAREGPLVADHPGLQGLDLLHRAHRDPHLHEAGPRDPRRLRPVVAAAARVGR